MRERDCCSHRSNSYGTVSRVFFGVRTGRRMAVGPQVWTDCIVDVDCEGRRCPVLAAQCDWAISARYWSAAHDKRREEGRCLRSGINTHIRKEYMHSCEVKHW